MSRSPSRSGPYPDPAPTVVVLAEGTAGDDAVEALTAGETPHPEGGIAGDGLARSAVDEGDGAVRPDVRTAATVDEVCVTVETETVDCVVVVGPDARRTASTVERETGERTPVVALTALDDRGRELCRCVRRLVAGRRAERAIRDEQSFLHDALDVLDDVFYVFDADARLVRWNRRLNEAFGLDDAELAGQPPEAFFVAADRERVRETAAEALAGNDVVVEADAETTTGRVRFELTGRCLETVDGRVLGFSGIARDVTRPRQTTEQLARENEHLDAFGRVLTHDLRNPLGVATGYLEQQRARHDTPELRRVARALDRIDDIIDEVRHSSRGAPIERSPVSLSDVARTAWDAVETRDAVLVVDARGTIEANRKRLQRLLENLFRNSVEHGSTGPRSQAREDSVEPCSTGSRSETGDITERRSVSSQNATRSDDSAELRSASSRTESDDSVEHGSTSNRTASQSGDVTGPLTVRVGDLPNGFVVADNGPGIPEEDREVVFRTGFTTSPDGTGYGLAIVRELAAMHGWRIEAARSSGGGARFEVRGAAVDAGAGRKRDDSSCD